MKKLDFNTFSLIQQIVDDTSYHNVQNFYDSTVSYKSNNGEIYGVNNLSLDILNKVEFSCMDFELGLAFDSFYIPRNKNNVSRVRSCRSFSKEKIPFEYIIKGVSESLIADVELRREYSSAGALYPVELFLSINTSKISSIPSNIKSGFYYIDSNASKAILLSEKGNDEINQYLMSDNSYFSDANFQIISVVNLPKSIFKYGERGFRNAIIEVGGINLLLKNTFSKFNIHSCESAEFDDYFLAKGLMLNPNVFKPILIQHFGCNYDDK